MTSPWWLRLGPLVGSAVVAALYAALSPGVTPGFIQAETVTVLGLTALASAAAAAAFGRGDYLFKAWVLLASCPGYLCLDVILFGAPTLISPRHLGPAAKAFSSVGTLTANLLSVAGLIVVARAFRVAGLPLAVSRRTGVILEVVLVLVAARLFGSSVIEEARLALSGDPDSIRELISVSADVTSLLLVGPILLTSLSLGGPLGRAWWFIAASTLAWLVLDGTHDLAALLHFGPVGETGLRKTAQALACFLQVSAALSQREASR